MFKKIFIASTIGSFFTLSLIAQAFPAFQSKSADPDDGASAATMITKANVDKPTIQVAILLDTSSSMDGLINQTRTELWSVINTLSDASKNGQRPILEVALYEYGQSTIPAQENQRMMDGPVQRSDGLKASVATPNRMERAQI